MTRESTCATPEIRQRDEQGSTLILALVFMTAVSLIVLALVNFAGNALADSAKFNKATGIEYTTGAAVQIEIQNLRFAYQPTNSTPTNCTPGNTAPISSTTTFTLNSVKVSVFCTEISTPSIADTRVITFYACEEDASTYTSATSCVANPFLQAQVSFNDYTLTDQNQCTSTSMQLSCGNSMKIAYWLTN